MNNEDEDKPLERSSRDYFERSELATELQSCDRVLAPLMKSLGWELASVGAEFPDHADTRKPTGRMRSLFGRQMATQSLVGSSPTASAIRM